MQVSDSRVTINRMMSISVLWSETVVLLQDQSQTSAGLRLAVSVLVLRFWYCNMYIFPNSRNVK